MINIRDRGWALASQPDYYMMCIHNLCLYIEKHCRPKSVQLYVRYKQSKMRIQSGWMIFENDVKWTGGRLAIIK